MVSSNFGFSFGFTAPPSSDATPIQEVPPAKRRKTVLPNEPVPVESIGHEIPKCNKRHVLTKSRRKFIVEDENDKAGKAQWNVEDDSFMAGLESKKKLTKRNTTAVKAGSDEYVAVAAPNSAVRARPRRHAATAAGAKVTDGFAEGIAPIDKKRRNAEPEKRAGRTRQKKDVDAVEDVARIAHRDDVPPRDTEPRPKATVRQRDGKRKRRDKIQEISIHQDIEEPPAIAVAPATSSLESRKTSRRRKEDWTPAEAPPACGLRHQDFEPLITKDSQTSAEAAAAKKKDRKKTAKSTGREQTCALEPNVDLQRQPLKEKDSNSPARSLSPAKAECDGEAGPPLDVKPRARQPHRKTARQHKLQIKHDVTAKSGKSTTSFTEATSEEACESATLGPSETGDQERPSRLLQDSHSKDAENSAAKSLKDTRKSKAKKTLDTSASDRRTDRESKSADNAGVASVEEEDMDWLLAPQELRRAPKSVPSQATPSARTSKTRAKMPDIDLDDLLSDIASIAQARNEVSARGAGFNTIATGGAKRSRNGRK